MTSFRAALQFLRRRPRLTLIAIAVVGPALAANAALFSVADVFLTGQLPYRAPSELYLLRHQDVRNAKQYQTITVAEFRAISESDQLRVAFFSGDDTRNVPGPDGAPLQLSAREVDEAFLQVLGASYVGPPRVMAGSADRERLVMRSRVWTRLYGRPFVPEQPALVKYVSGGQAEVVAVLPDSFVFPVIGPFQPDLLVVGSSRPLENVSRIFAIARVGPGSTVERAQAEITGRVSALRDTYSELRTTDVKAVSLADALLQSHRPVARGMAVLSVLGLLAAIATLGILVTDSVIARDSEFRLRLGIGASRGEVVGQVLIEAVTMSLAAGLVGLLVSQVWLSFSINSLPSEAYRLLAHDIDARTLSIALIALIALTSIACTGAALRVTAQSRSLSISPDRTTRKHGRLYSQVLLGTEAVIATVLVLAATQFFVTIRELRQNRLGFTPTSALTVTLRNPSGQRSGPLAYNSFAQALDRVRAVPGIEAAGASAGLPLLGGAPDLTLGSDATLDGAWVWRASAEFFSAAGIQLIQGREFAPEESSNADVCIVSEQVAESVAVDRQPLGKLISLGSGRGLVRIVGVVRDTRRSFVANSRPTIYLPFEPDSFRSVPIVIRTQMTQVQATDQIQQALRNLVGPGDIRVRALSEGVERALSVERFQGGVVAMWSLVGVLLAVSGVCILTTRAISSRIWELAIRAALGSGWRQLVSTAGGSLVATFAAGIVLGLVIYNMVGVLGTRLIREAEPLSGWWQGSLAGFLFVACSLAVAATCLRLRFLNMGTTLRGQAK